MSKSYKPLEKEQARPSRRSSDRPSVAARTKIPRTLAVVLCAASVLSTSGSAGAETFEERQACIGDAFQFCSSAIPNRDQVFNCLMDNRDRISAACHPVIAPNVPVEQAFEAGAAQRKRQQTATSRALNRSVRDFIHQVIPAL
jgi:hypothetical protein